MWERIGQETFMAATYLPCDHQFKADGQLAERKLEVVVKHPKYEGVNYLYVADISKNTEIKNRFANGQRQVYYKQIKKVKEVRHFSRPNSVFREFIEENKQRLDAAFDDDKQYMKIPKFISDPEEVNKVMKVLRRYYPQIKDQYATLIANSRTYPQIGLLDFQECCKQWDVLDYYLTPTIIDVLYVAVNYDELKLDANDIENLCRYELMEIIVRLAKFKFFEKGIDSSISEATEHLLSKYILPNTVEVIPGQEFRDKEVWTLDMDDLLKANRDDIVEIYIALKSSGDIHGKFEYDDAYRLVNTIGLSGVEYSRRTCLAYSLSKQLVINEMKDHHLYNDLKLFEFYEFLIRLAHLVFSAEEYGANYPVIKKLQQLLQLLIKANLNKNVTLPDLDAGIESDSDYEDDLVEEIL